MPDGSRHGQLQPLLRPSAPIGPIGQAVQNVAIVRQRAQLQQQQQQQQQVLQQQAEEKRRQVEIQQNLKNVVTIARFDGLAAERAFKEFGLGEALGTGDIDFVGESKAGRIFMQPGIPGQTGPTFHEVTPEGAKQIPNIGALPGPVKENVRIKAQKRLEDAARPFRGESKDQELDRIQALLTEAKASRAAGVPVTIPRDALRDLEEFDPGVFEFTEANRARIERAKSLLQESVLFNSQGRIVAPPTGAVPVPTGQPIKLDSITASQILDEAGGDKERARQIAKERGFEF